MADSPELARVACLDPSAGRARALIGSYSVAVAIAIALEGLLNASLGAALCAVLIVVLVNHHLATLESDAHGAFLILALVPLAGLLSVVMPAGQVTRSAWPILAAIPTFMAVALTARQLRLGRVDLGLKLNPLAPQIRIALVGLPLGLLAFVGLRPIALPSGDVAVAVVALVGLAFTEELLFRGLLQPLMVRLYDEAGVVITASLSAVVALGTRSASYAVCAGLVAVVFGIAARRTGSIAGVSVARALIYVGLLAWPYVL